MKFVALDLETTGLDPSTCQILEVGMVACESKQSPNGLLFVEELSTLSFCIKPRNGSFFTGEPVAIYMNRAIINSILDPEPGDKTIRVKEGDAVALIKGWLESLGYAEGERVNVCGKNAGSFDLPFLKQLPRASEIRFSHRTIDVGCLMLLPSDDVVPALDECLRRAGVVKAVSHRAVEDARDCVEVFRYWLKNQ